MESESVTRHQILSMALTTAITESRAAMDAALQGKSDKVPGPLYSYICYYVVFHFKLNGLVPPSVEELDEIIKHARSISNEVDKNNMKDW